MEVYRARPALRPGRRQVPYHARAGAAHRVQSVHPLRESAIQAPYRGRPAAAPHRYRTTAGLFRATAGHQEAEHHALPATAQARRHPEVLPMTGAVSTTAAAAARTIAALRTGTREAVPTAGRHQVSAGHQATPEEAYPEAAAGQYHEAAADSRNAKTTNTLKTTIPI